ncbi:unnamed protein product [Ectocarpus sp. CCAP 1310/34]|nr:unnamed protein product [Ectocarpus sp. CCAP 1310/34]
MSSRSLSGGEDERSSFADPAAFSEGAMEAMDAGDSNQAEGVEGLSLMQLELNEEDQPAVVPYGEGKDNGGVGVEGDRDGSGGHKLSSDAEPVNAVLSTPSVEHSQRWREIDRLLEAASPAEKVRKSPSMVTHGSAATAAAAPHYGDQREMASTAPPIAAAAATAAAAVTATAAASVVVPTAQAAAPAAPAMAVPATPSAEAAAAAKRYPLLFAATRANEDVMMAAARLVDPEEGEDFSGGSGRGAAEASVVREAVAFLEEVGASEDGAAAVWQVPVPAAAGGVRRR